MNRFDDAAIRAELGELRTALAALEVPALDEQALRARFREAAKPRRPATARVRAHLAPRRLAAAGVLLAAGVAALLAWLPGGERAPELAVFSPPPESVLAAQPLQSLPASPGFSSTAAFSVVRVRIPLTALAIVPGSEQGGTIEADLLVGEDGLAHGIRFTDGGAALGAARAQ